MPLFIKEIRTKTELLSNIWGGRGGGEALGSGCNDIAAEGFQRDVFNHQYKFIDSNTGIITKHVEAILQQTKAKFMIPDYLVGFTWDQRFKNHSYVYFWTQVA